MRDEVQANDVSEQSFLLLFFLSIRFLTQAPVFIFQNC